MKTKMSKVMISYLLVLCLFVGILPVTALPVIAATTVGAFGEVVTEDGIHFKKSLVTDLGENQPEVLKIEAWVDGEVTTSESSPADIILVLDQSGSMDDPLAGSEKAKLTAMKEAVSAFVANVSANNTENNDKYRVAIVGFASEDENTELLTTENPVLYNSEYKKVAGSTESLDTSKTYYIKSGSSYDEIRYYNPLFASDGWYEVGTLGLRGDAVASDAEIYEFIGAISEETYQDAFVNCTATSISSGGRIYKAIDALDGNGATRADLGLELAKNIFAAQSSDKYSDGREKIVVFLTDGVPTTSNEFSADVANDAIGYAKEMKDTDAHIFSLFLGTAGTDNSVNFMQGVSSNYPVATSYTVLGEKAADSYYSSHTDTAAITDVFTDIAISVSSPSKLDEKSVIADSLSDYFTLPSVDGEGSFNESQIYVYTVDWTGTAWATETVGSDTVEKRVRFEQATVEIDDATKEVRVSGFNFKHHCITTSPKDGTGGTDFGRKLVFYIPILQDQSADTFGGYLPTNNKAYIKETSESSENAVEAESCMHDTPIEYHLQAGTHFEHLEETADPVFFYNEDADGDGVTNMNGILAHMIHLKPDGKNNLGVDITYTLFDESDAAIATITVQAGESYEDAGLLDFASWNPVAEKMDLPSWVDETSTYIFKLEALLTSKEEVSSPQKLSVHQNLHVTLTKDETTHIVNGTIDENGKISVDSSAPGVLNSAENDYTEIVSAGGNSAEMTFSPNSGHYITKIEITTWHNSEHSIIYDLTDEDASNDALPTGMTDIKGDFKYTAENILGGVVVEVSTSPIMYALTSSGVNAMISPDSPLGTYKYSHHDSEKLKIDFAALDGYKIDSITIDNTPCDLSALPLDVSVNTEDGNIVSGEITLERTDNHSVSVSAVKRTYNLKFVQYKRVYNVTGYTYELYDAGAFVPTEFGATLTSPVPAVGEAGNPKDIGGTEYVFKNWYKIADIKADNTGEFRQLTVLANEKMPSHDLTLYGFWEATPNQEIGTVSIKKTVDKPVSDTFKFVAVMAEHVIGSLDLTISSAQEETGSITPKLSEAQEHQFHNGDVNIYVYEVDDGTGEYLFDKTRYVLKTDGATGFKLYNAADETTELTEAVFNNVENKFTVKYDLSGGNIGGNTSIADKNVKWEEENLLPAENPQKTGFKFMGWVYNEEFISNSDSYSFLAHDNTATKEITLVAYYEGDTIGENPDPYTPDNIPDKYQKMITYKIIGGTWDGAKAEDIIEVVTLKDAGGNPSESGSAALSKVPDETSFVKNTGYDDEGKGWAENPAPSNGAVVSGIEPLTYTYIFHKKPDVEYPKHDPDEPVPVVEVDKYNDSEDILVIPNGGTWVFDGTTHPTDAKVVLDLTENISLGEATREDFVFSGWKKTEPTAEDKLHPGASAIVAVYTAQWDTDEIGGDTDPNTSDDTADKYQKKITFKVVNGLWEDQTSADKVFVVDLLAIGNKLAEYGSADISGIIPVNMKPASGYEGGAWDIIPPEKVTGTGEVTYTYTFTKIVSGGGGGGGSRKYTLTYETNGGSAIPKETYSKGALVEITKHPVKEGYVLEGWYLDKELTKEAIKVSMTKNITVYAAWVEDNKSAGSGYRTPGKLNGEDHFAYVIGYPDGTVKPESNITRAEVTAIFFRLLKPEIRTGSFSTENTFGDVNANNWHNTAVSTMAKLGIVNGRAEGYFAPDLFITRAEFAAICARFDDSLFEVIDNFGDVKNHWAESEIHEAAAHGWIRGYEDNSFKPDQFITRAEAMTMINRVLNRVPEKAEDLLSSMTVWPDNSDKEKWYYLPVQEATNSHDYKMKNHIYEKWTALKENADWASYQ